MPGAGSGALAMVPVPGPRHAGGMRARLGCPVRRGSLLLVLSGLAACGTPPPLEPYCLPGPEAVQLLAALAAPGSGPPAPGIQVLPVQVPAGPRMLPADLYRPTGPPQAGVLMVPGVAQQGKDDPRLVAFARALARAHFAVLVPELPGVRDLQASASDVAEVAAAFGWLAAHPTWAPAGRAGIVGHSYALGPALLAAMQPELQGRVRFILGVGGYHDLRRVITFFTTGYHRAPGDATWRHLAPSPYGPWIFVLSHAERLASPPERAALRAMARRRLQDPAAPLADLEPALGAEGWALYDVIRNRDPERVPDLLERLPVTLRHELDALNPALLPAARLRARLLLLHGYEDRIVPFTESVALDRALPVHQARLFLVHGLAHVDLSDMPILDRWRLLCAVEALLAERRLGPP